MEKADSLTNEKVITGWLSWGFLWGIVAPLVGILVSLKFNFPNFLNTEYTVFGRLRPVHINGVIFAFFSTVAFGLFYYIVPKITGTRMYKEEWGRYLVWVWNLTMIAGFVGIMAGYNKGLEVAEFPLPVAVVMWLTFVVLAFQVFMTIARRKEEKLYVSLWYITAALVWTSINLLLGNFILPYTMAGVNNVALHGLFIHYTVGLWITPAGLGIIYYFLPVAARSPLYSQRLGLLGFWSLAFFYPFVGIHHYLFSPIVDWAETIAIVASMMLIIPVAAVLVNFFGTLRGKWHTFFDSFTVKLLIVGTLFYSLGSFQGCFEALRGLNTPTHFTDFVIAHSHLTIFGGYILFVLAGSYYVWPKITGRGFSRRIANYSTWLIIVGISFMGSGLIIQGLTQGTMLMEGAVFVDSLKAMKPYWLIRTFSGISMDLGVALVAINLLRGER
ncbi:MAG: cbb3-type cytochrome c oxidase subunit I [Nitrospirota bacterium]